MFNKIFSLLFFLFSNQFLYSQNIDKLEFKKTINSEISNSIANYLHSNNETNTKKLDSIKSIERKLLKSKIVGLWEFETVKCPDCVKGKEKHKNKMKYILVTKDEIIFYQKKVSLKNITRKEKITFTDKFDWYSGVTDLLFADNSIWSIQIDDTDKYLKIYNSGFENENSRGQIVSGISTNYYKKIK